MADDTDTGFADRDGCVVSAADPGSSAGDDFDRDSLHILPLTLVPLEVPGLQRARLIKNVRLENVIEVFNDNRTGSGQVRPENLPAQFESYKEEIERDVNIIQKLCRLNSFDVYSLRIELRRMSINVNNYADLSLSSSKKAELTEYMKVFTRPLMLNVYGNEARKVGDVSDIISMFANPDREEALRNLKMMADKLSVSLQDIPTFLEDYGDIFLSLAYFRQYIDGIIPEVHKFVEWTNQVLDSREVQMNPNAGKLIRDTGHDMTEITTSIASRFESFNQRSKDFWNDINADSFRRIRNLISSHHVTIGGVLCGLAVKMNLWRLRFARGGGGPHRRIEFIRSEILPGLSHIRALENSARATLE